MKKLLLLFCLICFSLPAFAEFYEGYAKSNFYFDLVKDSVNNYQATVIKNPKANKDVIFYSLLKDYERYVFAMNYYNIDDISELQCDNYTGKYKAGKDFRSNKVGLSEYYSNGFTLVCNEGMSAFGIDYQSLLNKYGSGISDTYKEWLKYKIGEIRFDDGQPLSTKKELKKQLDYVEKFAEDHPNFIGISNVVNELLFLQLNYKRLY